MPLDASTFLRQIESQIQAKPELVTLLRIIDPLAKKLRKAEADGDKNRVAGIYMEMQIRLRDALGGNLLPTGTDPQGNSPPDAPIDPFTDKEILKLNVENWVSSEVTKRLATMKYFGFDKLRSIYKEYIYPPGAEEIMRRMSPDKVQLIQSFQKPLLIITPIGASMNDLCRAFMSKKGAMTENKIPTNRWNDKYDVYSIFDQDIRGEIVYDVSQFTPQNHGGMTKEQLLKNPSYEGSRSYWRVFVVEGENVPFININRPMETFIPDNMKNGFSNLCPEDAIMIQAEGLSMGRSLIGFDGGNGTRIGIELLTGAYLPSLNRIPKVSWGNGPTQQLDFGSCPPDDTNQIPSLLSRQAVRIM